MIKAMLLSYLIENSCKPVIPNYGIREKPLARIQSVWRLRFSR